MKKQKGKWEKKRKRKRPEKNNEKWKDVKKEEVEKPEKTKQGKTGGTRSEFLSTANLGTLLLPALSSWHPGQTTHGGWPSQQQEFGVLLKKCMCVSCV